MSVVIVRDQVTAVLDAIGAKARDRRPVAEAMGLALVSLAIRSFNAPEVRAAPWAALKQSTIDRKMKEGTSDAILKRRGLLWRSWRVVESTPNYVKVGSDRPYASVHQWGSKNGAIPARPMLPMTGTPDAPRFSELATRRMISVAKSALEGLLLPKKGTRRPPKTS